MKLYQALYNQMIEESGYVTLSSHLSYDGAEQVIKEHRENKLKEFKNLYPKQKDEPYKFGTFEDWFVDEIDVLP